MSLFSKLFGGGSKSEAEPVEYKGYDIIADPISEGGKFRLSARIEKDVDGERKSHLVIRADVFDNKDQAVEFSLSKAKQVDKLFG